MKILATIASGLAGWLTYEDMLRKVKHHEERLIYDPIFEIARANGYHVEREFPLPRKPGQLGASKAVDFVFANPKTRDFAVLEIKFKKEFKTMAGSLGADALKIRDVNGDVLNDVRRTSRPRLPEFKPGDHLDHGILVVWRKGDIITVLKNREPPIIARQFLTILKGMFENPKHVTGKMLADAVMLNTPRKLVDIKAGHLRWGMTRTEKRYWLAILRKRPSWSALV